MPEDEFKPPTHEEMASAVMVFARYMAAKRCTIGAAGVRLLAEPPVPICIAFGMGSDAVKIDRLLSVTVGDLGGKGREEASFLNLRP